MLQELITNTYQLLQAAQNDPGLDWHWPVLTIGGSARIVVLRNVLIKPFAWRFYTDRRSEKVKKLLEQNGECAALFYDRSKRIQIRVHGIAQQKTSESLRRETWQQLSVASRRSYATLQPPGTTIQSPELALSSGWATNEPSEKETKKAFDNFLIAHVLVTRIEALDLSNEPHLRAVWTPGHESEAKWIVP